MLLWHRRLVSDRSYLTARVSLVVLDLPTVTYRSVGYDIETASPMIEETFSSGTPHEKVSSFAPANPEHVKPANWKVAWAAKIEKRR